MTFRNFQNFRDFSISKSCDLKKFSKSLFLYNEVYLNIIDFDFNEIKNNYFISFNNTTIT